MGHKGSERDEIEEKSASQAGGRAVSRAASDQQPRFGA